MFVFAGLMILNFFFYGILTVTTLVLGILLWRIFTQFIEVSKRFMEITVRHRSQLISIYLQSLYGSVYLRIHDNQTYLDNKFAEINDNYQRALSHFSNYSQRWLKMRLLIFKSALLFMCLCSAIISKKVFPQYFFSEIWSIGVAVSWSFKIILHLNSFVIYFADSFSSVISVSRIFDYIENCPTEFRRESESSKDERIKTEVKKTFQHILSNKNMMKSSNTIIASSGTHLVGNYMKTPMLSLREGQGNARNEGDPKHRSSIKHSLLELSSLSYKVLHLDNLNLYSDKKVLFDCFNLTVVRGQSIAVY